MKESSLRIGGLPLPISFLIVATSTRFFATNFRKDWPTCELKNFCRSSYIFEIIIHFLADKLFLIWLCNTPLHITPEGWIVYSIVYSPFQKEIQQMQFWVEKFVKKILVSISDKAFKFERTGFFQTWLMALITWFRKSYLCLISSLQEGSDLSFSWPLSD